MDYLNFSPPCWYHSCSAVYAMVQQLRGGRRVDLNRRRGFRCLQHCPGLETLRFMTPASLGYICDVYLITLFTTGIPHFKKGVICGFQFLSHVQHAIMAQRFQIPCESTQYTDRML